MQLNARDQSGANRSRWLAELAEAIEGAQRLAWQLGTADQPSQEARELYGRLEAARVEVEAMRGLSPSGSRSADPAPWPESLGWSGALLDPDKD